MEENRRFKKSLARLMLILLFVLGTSVSVFAQKPDEAKLYDKGNTLIVQGKWKEAAAVFKELLVKYPYTGYTDSRFWLGYAYVEMGKYKTGIKQLEQFATLYPHSGYTPQALFKTGEVYEKRLRNYDKALSTYENILKKYPGNNAALPAVQNQAVIYSQRKMDYDRALERYQKSKSLAQEQGRPADSDYLRRADQRIRFIRENSDYDYKPLKMFVMGMNQEEKRRWNEAQGIYQVLLKKYPDSKIADDAHYRVINCLLKMGKTAGAMAQAKEFLKTYPASPHTGKVKSILNRIDKDQGDFFFKGKVFVV